VDQKLILFIIFYLKQLFEYIIMIEETYDYTKLNYIREQIENMSKFNQVEILRILTKHQSVTINENRYGIHINLGELDSAILDELNMYIKYVNTQETYLNNIEKEKEKYKNTFF
jgi:hypothetical protein